MKATRVLVTVLLLGGSGLHADDWPQWMGPKRDSTWREDGIIRKFPAGGPKVRWRVPVAHGYAGPAVADGRVYLAEFVIEEGKIINNAGNKVTLKGKEQIRCLDAETGKQLWIHREARDYDVSYPGGPRSTPTVDGGQVVVLGPMGQLTCLGTDGKLQWQRDFGKDYGAPVPMWGHSAAPLVHGGMVICMVGGEGSLVVAFDRKTGKEKWRALNADHAGYCPPQIIEQAGVEQLVTWHPEGVSGLDPATGKAYWTVPLKPTGGAAVAMPRKLGSHLFASGYNKIGAMIALSEDKPGAKFEWRSGPKEGVYCVNSTPYLLGDTIYAVDIDESALMGVSMKDGKRLWETRAPTLAREIAERPRVPRHGTAFLVYHPGNKQFWLFGEMGDLIIAELSPDGYREVSRAHLLEPTNTTGPRPVLWSHPAFAMQSAFVRNDQELIRVDLAR